MPARVLFQQCFRTSALTACPCALSAVFPHKCVDSVENLCDTETTCVLPTASVRLSLFAKVRQRHSGVFIYNQLVLRCTEFRQELISAMTYSKAPEFVRMVRAHLALSWRLHTSLFLGVCTRRSSLAFAHVALPWRLHTSLCLGVRTRRSALAFAHVALPWRLHKSLCLGVCTFVLLLHSTR